jgi:hypothetical protein
MMFTLLFQPPPFSWWVFGMADPRFEIRAEDWLRPAEEGVGVSCPGATGDDLSGIGASVAVAMGLSIVKGEAARGDCRYTEGSNVVTESIGLLELDMSSLDCVIVVPGNRVLGDVV